MKMKVQQMTPMGNAARTASGKQGFPKNNYVIIKFDFLVNLFTTLFLLGLHTNHLIHHWEGFVNHYTTGVIGGHRHNFL